MLNLLIHELRSKFGAMIGWGIGLGAFGAMYIFIWPEAGEMMGDLSDLSIYQAMGIDMGSFAGFIASVVVQYVPIILGIYANIASTGTLAGEEDQGTLELVLSTRLQRWQVVTVKALALEIAVALMIIIAAVLDILSLEAIRGLIEVDVSASEFFVAMING